MARTKSSKRNLATTPSPSRKKRYHPPALIRHGSLLSLTKVKGGGMNDGGGKPMTRTAGMAG